MSQATAEGGIRWRAVVLGWVVSLLGGVALVLVLRVLHRRLLGGAPLEPAGLTAPLITISLLSGFLAYCVGGYVAGRTARASGGINGAMTAVLGLVVGTVVAAILVAAGTVFIEGVAIPPATFGLSGGALLASLILFAVNLVGGYLGGNLGQPAPREQGPLSEG